MAFSFQYRCSSAIPSLGGASWSMGDSGRWFRLESGTALGSVGWSRDVARGCAARSRSTWVTDGRHVSAQYDREADDSNLSRPTLGARGNRAGREAGRISRQSGEGADSGSFLMAADVPVRWIELSGNLPCPIHPVPESFVG